MGKKRSNLELLAVVVLVVVITAGIAGMVQYSLLGHINIAITFAAAFIAGLGVARHAALTQLADEDSISDL